MAMSSTGAATRADGTLSAGAAPLRIAYLGPEGTWTEAAARLLAGLDAELVPLTPMGGVVSAVETSVAAYGVLPIENSLEGSVPATLDLLIHETGLQISAEVVVPIRHTLLAAPGTNLAAIRVVRSHPQALGQCRRFLERVLPGVATAGSLSTTAAVNEVMRETGGAAIATPRAADLYGAVVLARDIQDKQNNATRFVLLGQHDSPPTGDDKTSLAFSVAQNAPGALVEILTVFAAAGINLSKLESRPAQDRLGQYIFLCDLEAHRSDPQVAPVLATVQRKVEWIKIFGSYPRWREAATGSVPPGLGPLP
ncbi:MAG: prephenate dehydratase [Bradyrhizobium sp.]